MDRKRRRLYSSLPPRIYGYVCKTEDDEFEYICDSCSGKFNNITDLEYHINNHELPITKFTDIPIEVMDYIFDFLHPFDLAAMSKTCKKFKSVVENYFQRKNQNQNQCIEMVVLNADSHNPKKYFQQNPSYTIRLRMSIPNLHVKIQHPTYADTAFPFIRENCSRQLRYLNLDSNQIFYMGFYANAIANQIENLKVLELRNVEEVGELIGRCNHLEVLGIRNSMATWQHSWSNERIPSLKTLIVHCTSPTANFSSILSRFLQNNQQLQNIVCNNLPGIKTLLSMQTTTPLPYLAIVVDMESIVNELPAALRQGHFQQIDINLITANYQAINRIIHNNCVIGLHLSLRITDAMNVHPNIQRLCLRLESSIDRDGAVEKLINCFPNLIELRLFTVDDFPVNILRKLVVGLKKIKRIYFEPGRYMESARISMHDANDLNMARSAIANVTRMSIHYSATESLNVPQQANSPDTRFVSIDNNYYDCPLCNFNYPSQIKALRFNEYLKNNV